MVYKSKRERMSHELLGIFEKNPVINAAFITRLTAELQIQYGVSKSAAKELIDAFVVTGRVKVEG